MYLVIKHFLSFLHGRQQLVHGMRRSRARRRRDLLLLLSLLLLPLFRQSQLLQSLPLLLLVPLFLEPSRAVTSCRGRRTVNRR